MTWKCMLISLKSDVLTPSNRVNRGFFFAHIYSNIRKRACRNCRPVQYEENGGAITRVLKRITGCNLSKKYVDMDISSMLEVQVNEVNEVDSKENVTPHDLLPCTAKVSPSISQEESNFYKLLFGNDISAVRFRRLHCTVCDAHIGSAPAEAHNMFEHPVLHTLLCAKCREFYGDGTFEQGDDETDMFCRWCANGGNLYCCSFCSNTFCYKCIKRNFEPVLRKKIEADENWKCFVCDPSDLYTARAVCWALLQHVRTVTRIIQNDSKIPKDKLDERMNLDDSQCCSRTRKRKRRRARSNSEEEDVTYIPNHNGSTELAKRRKKTRGKPKLPNGVSIPIPIRPRPTKSECNMSDHSDISTSLLSSCEQSMVECENLTINADGTIIAAIQASSTPSKVNSVVQPSLYNTAIMNVVSNSNFLQPSPSVVALRHISSPSNKVNVYQTMQCTSTPMVTIPNQNTSMLNRSRVFVPESRTATMTVTPNIIEIESDSDESAAVGPSRNIPSCITRADCNNATSLPAVPVALVSSKNKVQIVRKVDVLQKTDFKTLNQRLLPHGQEIDLILGNLKTKINNFFETSKRDELKKHDINGGRLMIKRVHREIRNTVIQLAHINDRLVREYNRWKRCQVQTNVNQSSVSNNITKTKSVDIPLDMTCCNESDSESEHSTESDFNIISPSDQIGITTTIEGIKYFRKKSTVDQYVCTDRVLLEDKSVQKYDLEEKDYEQCIGHSVVSKVDQEPHSNDSEPVNESKGNSNKYEEQFIFYLQRLEDRDMQSEDSIGLPDPNETPLKDLIEANSPFISKMLESMDNSIAANHSSKPDELAEENNSSTPVPVPKTSVSTKSVDDLVNIVNKINDDLDTNKKTPTIAPIRVLNESLKEKNKQKRSYRNSEPSSAGSASVTAKDTNAIKCKSKRISASTGSEEDCMIIDD